MWINHMGYGMQIYEMRLICCNWVNVNERTLNVITLHGDSIELRLHLVRIGSAKWKRKRRIDFYIDFSSYINT